jgi:hypothetical protein
MRLVEAVGFSSDSIVGVPRFYFQSGTPGAACQSRGKPK